MHYILRSTGLTSRYWLVVQQQQQQRTQMLVLAPHLEQVNGVKLDSGPATSIIRHWLVKDLTPLSIEAQQIGKLLHRHSCRQTTHGRSPQICIAHLPLLKTWGTVQWLPLRSHQQLLVRAHQQLCVRAGHPLLLQALLPGHLPAPAQAQASKTAV